MKTAPGPLTVWLRSVIISQIRTEMKAMKTTMIFTAEGDTYLSVAYKPVEAAGKGIKPLSTLYFAETTGSEKHGFSVRFRLPFFERYSRSGFLTKQSALNYQQDIFDKYFEDYIADSPAEMLA